MNFILMLAIPVSLVLVKFFGVWGGLRYAGPRLYPNVSPNLPVAAGVRTGLGMVATGILAGLGALLAVMINNPQYSSLFSGGLDVSFFFTLQLLFRAAIWLFVVVWFYDRRLEHRTEAAKLVVGGVVLSYLLDVPNLLVSFAGVAWLFHDARFC